jgi:diguanylate cyclase (GGDEF)-like protein
MAEVSRLTSVSQVVPLGSHSDQGTRKDSEPKHRPQKRSPDAVLDAASVMGIPRAELSPRVLEALTLILHEMDELRWDLEVSRERERHLESLADGHAVLPVLNRRAFVRELGKTIRHVENTQTPSTLVYIDISNLDQIKRTHGVDARDTVLKHVADLLLGDLREIDLVGEITGDLAIILNLADAASAKDKAEIIAKKLMEMPVRWSDQDIPITVRCGVYSLQAGEDPWRAVQSAADVAQGR